MAKKKKDKYVVSIKVNGQDYNAEAETLDEALLLFPKISAKTAATIVVSKNDVSAKPIHMTIPMFNRLFYPGMTGQVQRVQLSKRYQMLT